MKKLEIQSKNISKALYPWTLVKGLYHSAYISNLLKLTIVDETVTLHHDDENVFIIEDYGNHYAVHGIFKDKSAVMNILRSLNKKAYMWLLDDLGLSQGKVTKYILKKNSNSLNSFETSEPSLKLEDIIQIVHHELPQVMSLAYRDLIKRSYLEKTYIAEKNSNGNIDYLQSYILRDKTYSGIYLHSQKTPLETISTFVKIHESLDVDHFETWITSWNEKSKALHKLLGYQETDQHFYLVSNV